MAPCPVRFVPTDVIGRPGGDDVAVVSLGAGASGATAFFDRVHERLLEAVAEQSWTVGFSMGGASFPDRIPELDEALERADALMYRAKAAGKNSVIRETFQAAGPAGVG